jgi:hypothetical protein
VTSSTKRYALDGTITVDRLTTTITIADTATDTAAGPAGLHLTRLDDTYRGEASFTLDVPREQRHATGTSQERYRLSGDTRYDHTIETRNGLVTTDRTGPTG